LASGTDLHKQKLIVSQSTIIKYMYKLIILLVHYVKCLKAQHTDVN